MKRFMKDLIAQRIIGFLLAIVTFLFIPMPSTDDLGQWQEAEKMRRLNSSADACAGKWLFRPIWAWWVNRRFGEKWGEYMVASQAPWALLIVLWKAGVCRHPAP